MKRRGSFEVFLFVWGFRRLFFFTCKNCCVNIFAICCFLCVLYGPLSDSPLIVAEVMVHQFLRNWQTNSTVLYTACLILLLKCPISVCVTADSVGVAVVFNCDVWGVGRYLMTQHGVQLYYNSEKPVTHVSLAISLRKDNLLNSERSPWQYRPI